MGCISAVAFSVLSPLPLVIESPLGYSTTVCLVALWEKHYFEFDPSVGGGEKMKKSAVINQADSSLRRYSL